MSILHGIQGTLRTPEGEQGFTSPLTTHVTNGDSVAHSIRESLPGEIIVWRDVLHEGPVPGGLSARRLAEVRARFLAENVDGSYDDILQSLVERDNSLDEAVSHGTVNFWFERDIYDQLQLVQILDRLDARRAADYRIAWIEFGGDHLLDTPLHPLGEKQISAGASAWRAFTSPDPQAIEHVLARDLTPLPYLAEAFVRHLEQYPSTHNGLGRTQQQTLRSIGGNAKRPIDLFVEVAALETYPFLGDTWFWHYLEHMPGGRHPLLTPFRGVEHPIALTEAGRAVLDGQADAVELNGIDCWLGGVHLSGDRAAWRWDVSTRRLVKSHGLGLE